MEKISVAILTTQEIIISLVYLAASIRILHTGQALDRKGNRHRIKLLLLSNMVIIALDVCVITLEFLALWGIWCSFKGFGYSVKLKVEFAILNQLRDSVRGTLEHDNKYGSSSKGTGVLSRKDDTLKSAGMHGRMSMKRGTFEQIPEGAAQIEKTTEIDIKHHDLGTVISRDMELQEIRPTPSEAKSESSSEVDFARRGV